MNCIIAQSLSYRLIANSSRSNGPAQLGRCLRKNRRCSPELRQNLGSSNLLHNHIMGYLEFLSQYCVLAHCILILSIPWVCVVPWQIICSKVDPCANGCLCRCCSWCTVTLDATSWCW